MRHFAPPHSPDVIPNMAADIQTLCNDSLDKVKAKGGNTFDVVDDYAYPVPVAVICQILGVPVKDEPTFHELDLRLHGGRGHGTGRRHRRRTGPPGEGPRKHGGDERSTWPI